MSIQDIYSKRNSGGYDFFSYDVLSEKLKIQIVHIWQIFFKQIEEDTRDKVWEVIHSTLCQEHGKKTLLQDGFQPYYDSYKVEHYFENNGITEECLDVIEIVFRVILNADKYHNSSYNHLNYKPEEAVKDLNTRFIENKVGFEFLEHRLIKIDNNYLHIEITKPSLCLLHDETYKNANEEYINAHEHFRYGRNKECLNECLKAFESTIKIICFKNTYTYKETDTAKNLINTLLLNDFIPKYHESQLSALRQLLESSIPTIRNKNGGHGQGPNAIIVKQDLASYMLYITGATIKFLIDIENARNIKPSH